MTEMETKALQILHAEYGEGDDGVKAANREWRTRFETWDQIMDAFLGCALEFASDLREQACGPTHYLIAGRLSREYFQRVGRVYFLP